MYKYSSVALIAFLLVGCSAKTEYYEAVNKANQDYYKAYEKVENETVMFSGTFDGTVSIVKPKKLPQAPLIAQPKDWKDYALQSLGIIAPTATAVMGLHYGYKTQDSANRYNAENISSWTSNFQNTSTTESSVVENTTTESTTTESVNTQTIPQINVDVNSTTIN